MRGRTPNTMPAPSRASAFWCDDVADPSPGLARDLLSCLCR